MRELLFILGVILVLLVLTAVRYRKQIANVIGVARMLKQVKGQMGQATALPKDSASVQLVSCSKCGVWVPQTKAVNKAGSSYCSNECALERVT